MKKKMATVILLLCVTAGILFAGGKTETQSSAGVKSGKYTEAPELAALVKEGKLPPVEQRLPPEPVVVKPKERIGKYGGTFYSMAMGPQTTSDAQVMMNAGLVRFSNDVSTTINDVAEHWEFSKEYKSFTVKLREGIKWSSGNPLTADDILFVFNDFLYDLSIQPAYPPRYAPDGKAAKLTKIDNYTVRFDFAIPYPSFPLIHTTDFVEPYVDSVWTKQFHIKYNPDADKIAKQKGFPSWQAYFLTKINGPNGGFALPRFYGAPDVEKPVLGPWRPVEVDSTKQVYERNPYYWKVDTEGNQLPYINRVVVNYATDLNVVNLKAMTGELTIAGLDLLLINYPDLKDNEKKGDYTVHLVYSERTADVAIAFNQLHPNPEMNKLFTNPQFRKAMSMGINRNEINTVVFLGQALPMQATISPSASFYEKRWGDEAAQFDPVQANRILDSLGLQKRNNAGIRLMPDGKECTFQLDYLANEGPKKETLEMVSKQWRDNLGIRVDALSRDRGFIVEKVNTSTFDATGWHVDRVLERAAWNVGWWGKIGVAGDSIITYANPWKQWFNTNGTQGIKPPAKIIALYDAYVDWGNQPFGSDSYKAAGKKVYNMIADETFVIGVVGGSPLPLLIKNNLKNVFTAEERKTKLWWGAANWFEMGFMIPEQLYLE